MANLDPQCHSRNSVVLLRVLSDKIYEFKRLPIVAKLVYAIKLSGSHKYKT